jgi:hypothetical protein
MAPVSVTDPGTASCAEASGTDGWDETRCYDDVETVYCWGRIGQYWFGIIFGDCQIDTYVADATLPEVPAANAVCQ